MSVCRALVQTGHMTRREFAAALYAARLASANSKFTDSLWAEAKPIYQKTLAHPFLTGLADGTLPMEKFRFYMLQDALYLRQYSKALSALAAKAPREDWALFFNRGAIECIETERKLHESYFSAEDLKHAQPAPTTVAYTNHLLTSVHTGAFADGLSAVTPCYWIYAEVGKELKKRGSRHNAYQKWIDQYAGEDFTAAVGTVLGMINSLNAYDPARFRELFMRSVRYEYLFWDMAWRLEKWEPK